MIRYLHFRTIFALLFSLTLGGFGVWVGLLVPQMPAFWILPSGRELSYGQVPFYFAGMIGLIGLLSGVWVGPRLANLIIQAGKSLERMSVTSKILVGVGCLLGAWLGKEAADILFLLPIPLAFKVGLSILFWVIFIYLGIVAMMSMKTELTAMLARGSSASATAKPEESDPMANCKILDTNVIIDGRIADVCHTGFVEGPLYVPGFVLEELQHIADSGDSLKRARGRRGLDILNNMQKDLPLIVRSWDKVLDNLPQEEEVDARLVRLAKALKGTIVTNDFNLNKVAALQGVQVLNVNELANALKPVVLPGEVMTVGIVKEGKEQNQGVAYLDDGTMIVVEDGRRYIGETLNVTVTSVLQTVAGKMIFARVRTDDEGDSIDYNTGYPHEHGNGTSSHAPNSGGYTRRGTGKKVR